jgi:hypothetical protein
MHLTVDEFVADKRSRTGKAILLIGTNAEATFAGADFITSEERMKKLYDSLHSEAFPYFEALLKVWQVNTTSLKSELVAYRTY